MTSPESLNETPSKSYFFLRFSEVKSSLRNLSRCVSWLPQPPKLCFLNAVSSLPIFCDLRKAKRGRKQTSFSVSLSLPGFLGFELCVEAKCGIFSLSLSFCFHFLLLSLSHCALMSFGVLRNSAFSMLRSCARVGARDFASSYAQNASTRFFSLCAARACVSRSPLTPRSKTLTQGSSTSSSRDRCSARQQGWRSRFF